MKTTFATLMFILALNYSSNAQMNDKDKKSTTSTSSSTAKSERTMNPNVVEYINTSGNITTQKSENPYLKKEMENTTSAPLNVTTEKSKKPE